MADTLEETSVVLSQQISKTSVGPDGKFTSDTTKTRTITKMKDTNTMAILLASLELNKTMYPYAVRGGFNPKSTAGGSRRLLEVMAPASLSVMASSWMDSVPVIGPLTRMIGRIFMPSAQLRAADTPIGSPFNALTFQDVSDQFTVEESSKGADIEGDSQDTGDDEGGMGNTDTGKDASKGASKDTGKGEKIETDPSKGTTTTYSDNNLLNLRKSKRIDMATYTQFVIKGNCNSAVVEYDLTRLDIDYATDEVTLVVNTDSLKKLEEWINDIVLKENAALAGKLAVINAKAETKAKALEEANEKLEKANEKLEKANEKLEEEKKDLEEDLKEFEEEKKKLEEEKKKLAEANEKLAEANEKLAKEKKDLEEEKKALEEANEKLEEANEKLEKANEKLAKELEEAKKPLSKAAKAAKRKTMLNATAASTPASVSTPTGTSITQVGELRVRQDEAGRMEDLIAGYKLIYPTAADTFINELGAAVIEAQMKASGYTIVNV